MTMTNELREAIIRQLVVKPGERPGLLVVDATAVQTSEHDIALWVLEHCDDAWHHYPSGESGTLQEMLAGIAACYEKRSGEHTFAVEISADYARLQVACPYDKADETRPCWPFSDESGYVEREPAPQTICTYESWVEHTTLDEIVHGARVIPLGPVEVEWDDGALMVHLRATTAVCPQCDGTGEDVSDPDGPPACVRCGCTGRVANA